MYRRFITTALFAATVTVVTLSPTPAHAQSSYRLTDLGSRSARGLNNAGQVAGAVSTPDGPRVWRWTDTNGNGIAEAGEFVTFSVPKGYNFASMRNTYQHLNNLGQIAGVVQKTTYTIPEFAYVWNASGTNGTSLSTGYSIQKVSSEAFGINDNGDVAGIDYGGSVTGNVASAYLWKLTGGTYTTIRLPLPPPAPGTSVAGDAFDVNNARQVVGATQSAAFVWSEATGLTILPGGGGGGGNAINNAGYIAGNTTEHALVWVPSTDNGTTFALVDLNPGGAGVSSAASDVNNVTVTPITDGVSITFKVVGTVNDASGSFAALWDVNVSRTSSGQSITWTMTNLNSRIAPGSGWVLTEADAVNDRGQVLCYGKVGGQSHPVLLTPQ